MKRSAIDKQLRADPQYYTTTFNDRCGFVIIKEGAQRLLWITMKGELEFFACANLAAVLEILHREEIVKEFAGEWNYDSKSDELFDVVWENVLADVREKCGRWEMESLHTVPERVKKQLLWAFDSAGKLDGDRFVTILTYEHVQLTPAQMAELASELTRQPRRIGFSTSPN